MEEYAQDGPVFAFPITISNHTPYNLSLIHILTDKSKFDLMILGPDNLAAFAGKLDRICFFSNYTGEIITARGDDSLVVVRGKPEDIENVIYQDEEKTIFLNYLTRAELRKLEKEMSLEAVPAEAIDKYVARFET